MSQEEQKQQQKILNAKLFEKGFTLTGVWHWRPSLVILGKACKRMVRQTKLHRCMTNLELTYWRAHTPTEGLIGGKVDATMF